MNYIKQNSKNLIYYMKNENEIVILEKKKNL